MAWLSLLRRAAPYLLIVVACAGLWIGGKHEGRNQERLVWQAKWAQRNTDDATAQAAAESAARAKEQSLQQQAEKVQRDATQALETARTDAAGERAATERLRGELAKLQTRLRGTGASAPAGTSSASATRAAMVLSDLYGSCQSRLGEVSSAFDRARVAGLACERSYDGLTK